MKIIYTLLLTAILAYIIIGAILYVNQRTFLYHPQFNTTHQYKDIFLNNDSEKIQIIEINPKKERAIIYFGGNAEPVSNSTEYIKKQFPDYAIYLMNYRGYGLSSGKPSEEGLFSDALALYDYIRESHDNISIGGRSIGSGIAAYVASKRDIRKLALITPYNSIREIAQDKYPIYPMKLLLKDQYDTGSIVKDIAAETLIITAENDTLIPSKYSNNLIEKFKELKKVDLKTIEIKGRGHGDISSDDKYFKAMQKFID